ncbi:hypothetical protein FRB99_005057 [Tulasnella sp. 403]|nr:hypothetical protein FRB99_005057 [Tulasnella sp. 403]
MSASSSSNANGQLRQSRNVQAGPDVQRTSGRRNSLRTSTSGSTSRPSVSSGNLAALDDLEPHRRHSRQSQHSTLAPTDRSSPEPPRLRLSEDTLVNPPRRSENRVAVRPDPLYNPSLRPAAQLAQTGVRTRTTTPYARPNSIHPVDMKVIRRTKSGGFGLCGVFGGSAALANFEDCIVTPPVSKLDALQVAVEVVQEEFGPKSRKSGTYQRASTFSLIGRKRSASNASKAGVAV